MKKCSKCLEIKQLSEFETRPDSKDGYRKYCRKCKCKRHNERLKERYSLDEVLFWEKRANYLNNPSGRRTGKSGEIVKNSSPISCDDIFKLYKSQPYCYYCNIPLLKENIVLDHKHPLCRNGNHDITNIAICCNDCNQLKGIRTSEEFELFIYEYLSRFGNTELSIRLTSYESVTHRH